jgi:hypothetical protein
MRKFLKRLILGAQVEHESKSKAESGGCRSGLGQIVEGSRKASNDLPGLVTNA